MILTALFLALKIVLGAALAVVLVEIVWDRVARFRAGRKR